jgi:exodeoxyribonuclease-3
MRIVTWNVNGIRAAARKGMMARVDALRPDALVLQEVRATPDQLGDDLREPAGWRIEWHSALRPGYSGTAAWSRRTMKIEGRGMDGDADEEGRVLVARIDGIRVVNTYLPSGSSSEERQRIKDAWLPVYGAWVAGFARSKVPTIICGDLNIAHTPRDIFYAKANEGTSGFLPHERKWMGDLLASGWHDVVREEAGERDGPYTWWSNRGQARALDRGWRIDYILCNKAARKLVTGVAVHREESLGISDHAPVSVDLDV